MLRVLALAGVIGLFSSSAWAVALVPGAPDNFIDFAARGVTDQPSFTFDVGDGKSVTATGRVLRFPTLVRQTASGLGVNGGRFDPEKDEVGVLEELYLDFDSTFNLSHIVIDDLTQNFFKIDTGVVKLIRDGHVLETVRFDARSATNEMLTLAFAEGRLVDHLAFYVPIHAPLSNFAVRGISEVPVPAALPLLATALGGLAWMRRRRQAA